jgi:SAM-dependent methyltransferase
MSLTAEAITWLGSPAGERALGALALLPDADVVSEQAALRLLTGLRQAYTPEQAAVLLTTARLRLKARAKFGDDAARMLFLPDALEQASDPAARAYRAAYGRGRRVLDAGCGIGSDTMAFADAAQEAHGIDIDPLRIAVARHNAQVLGSPATFSVGDITTGDLGLNQPGECDTIFFDPGRRDAGGRRIHHVEQYRPPLSTMRAWRFARLIVKLSPAVDLREIAAYGGGVEFVSVAGALKEGLLVLGGGWEGLRATRLEDGQVHRMAASGQQDRLELRAPTGWLVEPDPAILRARLVVPLGASLGGFGLDPDIAYFCTPGQPDSVWVRSWRIRAWLPFQLKRLRALLREHNIGHLTIRKRGFAMEPDELQGKLRLQGSESATLVLTRYAGKPVVILCDDAHFV